MFIFEITVEENMLTVADNSLQFRIRVPESEDTVAVIIASKFRDYL